MIQSWLKTDSNSFLCDILAVAKDIVDMIHFNHHRNNTVIDIKMLMLINEYPSDFDIGTLCWLLTYICKSIRNLLPYFITEK